MGWFLFPLTLVALAWTPADGRSQMHPDSVPIAGAWQWLGNLNAETGELDVPGDGRLLVTNGYHCAVFRNGERPAPAGPEPTEAEMALLFRTMAGPTCGSSAFTATGDEWEWEIHNDVAAHPLSLGRWGARIHRVVGDAMYGRGRTAGPVQLYLRRSGVGRGPLAGAWELVGSEWSGMLVLTDSQYRLLLTRLDQPSATRRAVQLTDAEAAALYRAYEAEAGSYTADEASMTWRPELAKDPRAQGRGHLVAFRLDEDRLETTWRGRRLVWRRLR